VPQQVFHEGNSVAHVTDFEGQPGRRPLTYDEVQALSDAADGRVEHARLHGHKGALPALRDAALLKTVYAYGFRRREVQRPDLRRCRSTANTARGSCGGASPPTVARPSDGRC
jgi:site-specific recombinase XerD